MGYYYPDYAYSWWWFVMWLFIYGAVGFLITFIPMRVGGGKLDRFGWFIVIGAIVSVAALWILNAILNGMVPW